MHGMYPSTLAFIKYTSVFHHIKSSMDILKKMIINSMKLNIINSLNHCTLCSRVLNKNSSDFNRHCLNNTVASKNLNKKNLSSHDIASYRFFGDKTFQFLSNVLGMSQFSITISILLSLSSQQLSEIRF